MSEQGRQVRVLAVDPISRGMAYAILEGSTLLVDYAVIFTRATRSQPGLRRLGQLIERFQPDVLVVENWRTDDRRCPRVRVLLDDIERLGRKANVKTVTIPWSRVVRVFGRCGAENKFGVAVVVARMFPELEEHLPRPRRPWMTVDRRFGYFNAVALAVAFFCLFPGGISPKRASTPSTKREKRRS